jgi:hypothetical protein
MAEGEVRVAATGLPRLDPPQVYVAWITNTSTGEAMRLGSFNTAYTSGAARLDTVLPDAIPDKGWNLFLLTVEDAATPEQAGARHSLAGYFPPTTGEALPNLLPNTGGPVPASASQPDWLPAAGLATLTLLVGIGAGYAVGIRRS